MKETLTVFHLSGLAAGLAGVLTASGCNPARDDENAKAPPSAESTGIPEEVAEEVEAITRRLEADALSEAGLRVKGDGKDGKAFATQGSGIPDEVAEEVDAITRRLEADALSEAGLRVRSDSKGEEASSEQPAPASPER